MKDFRVYILLCADDSYYVGMTSNLQKRILQHETSYFENSYTSSRLPVELVYQADCPNFKTAERLEKQLKGWSRAKKKALVEGKLELLPKLAKKKFD